MMAQHQNSSSILPPMWQSTPCKRLRAPLSYIGIAEAVRVVFFSNGRRALESAATSSSATTTGLHSGCHAWLGARPMDEELRLYLPFPTIFRSPPCQKKAPDHWVDTEVGPRAHADTYNRSRQSIGLFEEADHTLALHEHLPASASGLAAKVTAGLLHFVNGTRQINKAGHEARRAVRQRGDELVPRGNPLLMRQDERKEGRGFSSATRHLNHTMSLSA